MKASRTRRRALLISAVLAIVLSIGGYAFTASNTVPNASLGQGSNTISGYTVSAVVYNLNAGDPVEPGLGRLHDRPDDGDLGQGSACPGRHLVLLHQHGRQRQLRNHVTAGNCAGGDGTERCCFAVIGIRSPPAGFARRRD